MDCWEQLDSKMCSRKKFAATRSCSCPIHHGTMAACDGRFAAATAQGRPARIIYQLYTSCVYTQSQLVNRTSLVTVSKTVSSAPMVDCLTRRRASCHYLPIGPKLKTHRHPSTPIEYEVVHLQFICHPLHLAGLISILLRRRCRRYFSRRFDVARRFVVPLPRIICHGHRSLFRS